MRGYKAIVVTTVTKVTIYKKIVTKIQFKGLSVNA